VHYLVFATGPQGFGRNGAELRQKLALILSTEVGARVDVVAVSSYAELLRGIDRGTAQAAWCPPAVFVRAENAVPLCRAIRHGTTSFRGALYTRAASAFEELDHLKEASLAWVDPYSCSGHLFPQLALADRGLGSLLHGPQRFFGSQGAVARAVLWGDVDVGAGYVHLAVDGSVLRGSYSQVDPSAAVRVLLVTDPVPNDTICASRDLDPETAARLLRSLSGLAGSKEGRSILDGLFQCAELDPRVEPSDYDGVRRAVQLASSVL
jgi:ABC-type phosphate/phosphonate transport system substrate-binding protein